MEIMILGTFHFMKQNINLVEGAFSLQEDQIIEVVEALQAYPASKVMVEHDFQAQASLDQAYEAYLKGERALNSNEIQQLGFRLGQVYKHKRLYGVDWNQALSDSLGMGDVFDIMKAQGRGDQVEALLERLKEGSNHLERMVENQSLRAALKYMNQAQVVQDYAWQNECLMEMNTDQLIGNRWLMYWYYRNANIVSRILQCANEEDRVLLIYGGAHHHILKYLLGQNPSVTLVDVVEYL